MVCSSFFFYEFQTLQKLVNLYKRLLSGKHNTFGNIARPGSGNSLGKCRKLSAAVIKLFCASVKIGILRVHDLVHVQDSQLSHTVFHKLPRPHTLLAVSPKSWTVWLSCLKPGGCIQWCELQNGKPYARTGTTLEVPVGCHEYCGTTIKCSFFAKWDKFLRKTSLEVPFGDISL